MAKPNEHQIAISDLGKIADELRREGERLQTLAKELAERERAMAAIEAEYRDVRSLAYAQAREYFAKELPPFEGDDLEAVAKAEGAMTLEEAWEFLGHPGPGS